MNKMKLPTGIASYEKMRVQNYYTVDKTLMIRDFLELGSEVTLITRPRRFGKTINMSMMSEFFDITKDAKDIFKDTNILNTEYAKEMNQYPTVFLSFLNAKGDLNNVIKFIKQELLREFDRFSFIVYDLKERLQRKYNKILDELEDDSISLRNVNDAISLLTLCLKEYYGKNVMVFIDEYDTPFIEAHVHKFYEELHVDLASLLRTALKGNDALQYAMLTGIQRVAKENIFSDLNNMDVYTMKDTGYAEYFGFTKEETKDLLEYYGLKYNKPVKDMYDGYCIGSIDIYNPWSIINYAKHQELRPYWVNTSSNGMIKQAMERSDASFQEGFETLILNKQLTTIVNMETSFYEQSSTPSLWALFVNAGYLTIDKLIDMNKCRIRIPNKEVVQEFKSLTANYLKVSETTLEILFDALVNKRKDEFMKTYESIFLRIASYHDLDDVSEEKSYHQIMLGMCIYLDGDYTITSNRESGKGRSDILLKSNRDFLPSFVIEFKHMGKETYKKNPESLNILAQAAVDQIVREKYDVELTGEIIYIGLAHAGKNVAMQWNKK